jgi:DNA-directed RNA polymerase sigma subunit (sigma70/sigma32)
LLCDVSYCGGLIFNRPDVDESLDGLRDTCALDVADRGGTTLEEVGLHMNLTRERIRQIEEVALDKLYCEIRFPGLLREK